MKKCNQTANWANKPRIILDTVSFPFWGLSSWGFSHLTSCTLLIQISPGRRPWLHFPPRNNRSLPSFAHLDTSQELRNWRVGVQLPGSCRNTRSSYQCHRIRSGFFGRKWLEELIVEWRHDELTIRVWNGNPMIAFSDWGEVGSEMNWVGVFDKMRSKSVAFGCHVIGCLHGPFGWERQSRKILGVGFG